MTQLGYDQKSCHSDQQTEAAAGINIGHDRARHIAGTIGHQAFFAVASFRNARQRDDRPQVDARTRVYLQRQDNRTDRPSGPNVHL